MKNSDKSEIKKVVDSVINLHIQRIPYVGDSVIMGSIDLGDMRERVSSYFGDEVTLFLEELGFSAVFNPNTKSVIFQANSIHGINLSVAQRNEAASHLRLYHSSGGEY